MPKFKIGNKVQQKFNPRKIGTVIEIKERTDLSTGAMYKVKLRDKTIQLSTGDSFKKLNH